MILFCGNKCLNKYTVSLKYAMLQVIELFQVILKGICSRFKNRGHLRKSYT